MYKPHLIRYREILEKPSILDKLEDIAEYDSSMMGVLYIYLLLLLCNCNKLLFIQICHQAPGPTKD